MSSPEGGDLSSVSSIASRLSATFDTVQEKCDLRDVDTDNLEVALAALLLKISTAPGFVEMKKKEIEQELATGGDAASPPSSGNHLKSSLLSLLLLAELAYEEDTAVLKEKLKDESYILLRHDTAAGPGDVGRYYAICPDQKEFLIGVKGTSSSDDAITDCAAVAIPHSCQPNNPFSLEGSSPEMRGHEGILMASIQLCEDVGSFIEHLFLPLGYKIKIVGHSLGAGTSALLAVLLRARFAELIKNPEQLQAWCFACPAVLDIASSKESKAFITCIVNKSDCVPRASIGNVEVLIRSLAKLSKVMKDMGKQSMWSVFTTPETEMDGETFEKLITILNESQADTKIDHPDHLYVPGRVLMLYDNTEGTTSTSSVIVDGTNKVLRLIDLDANMLTHHTCGQYRESLESCLP